MLVYQRNIPSSRISWLNITHFLYFWNVFFWLLLPFSLAVLVWINSLVFQKQHIVKDSVPIPQDIQSLSLDEKCSLECLVVVNFVYFMLLQCIHSSLLITICASQISNWLTLLDLYIFSMLSVSCSVDYS